jgi:hypothetical protein
MKVEFNLNWDNITSSGWVDYSKYVNIQDMKLSKSLNSDNDPQKHATGEIEIWEDAYVEVKSQLIDSADRYANFFVIRVTDQDCGDVEMYFKIEDKNLSWCDNGECKLHLTLIEYNPVLDCIHQYPIGTNNSGEFQDYPASGMPHPRFRYCDVVKPTFLYGVLITFVNAVSAAILSINIAIASMTGIIVWIVNFLGGSWSVPQIGYGFAESLMGCSRGFPAPFIRTYIDNICSICGTTADSATIPTFYLAVDANGYTNQYYYACLVSAFTKKGVDMDGGKDYIPANEVSWTLDKFLSILKQPFNARWFIKDSVVYFNRFDLIGESIWGTGNAVDFSTGTDSSYLLGDVCYTFNGQGKPKRMTFKWGTDPSDNIGNELLSRFNGIYEDGSNNKNFNEIIEQNNYELGVAACVLDGQDGAYDVNIDKALSNTLTSSDYSGCLKTQGDTFALPKIVIYEPTSPIKDARVAGAEYDIYGEDGADIQAMKDDEPNFWPLLSSDCKNYNYPMSFDPDANNIGSNGFKNLWEYQSASIPSASKKSNIDVDFTLEYCCRFSSLNIYQKVMLKDGVQRAEIYSVDFDYQKREIKIKAKLI